MRRGCVYLVALGPGNPDLLTVRGLAALRDADLVIAPAGVTAELRAEASSDAAWLEVPVGEPVRPDDAVWTHLSDLLSQGGTAVRLYQDDPLLDPVGVQEARAFAAATLPFELVPGPSRLLTAASYAGIPLPLDREPVVLTSSPALVGAGSRGTLLLSISASSELQGISEALIRDGRDSSSPAALIERQASPDQVTHSGTLAALGREVTAGDAGGVLVVGNVASEGDDLHWFERLPLFGKRVLVTRATAQASRLSRLLREYGAEPVELPAIRIVPPEDFSALDSAVERLDRYDWVIFTSVNGVDTFFDRVAALDKDARAFGRSRIAAIGTATADRLGEHGLRADFVPERFVAEDVMAGLVERGIAGKYVLLPRAELARDVLPDGLRDAGANVDVVVAYRTLPAEPSPEALRRVEAGEIDIMTFASSSTVRNLVSLLGGRTDPLERSFIACIGPITARTAADLGLRVDLVAQEYSVPGLVSALVNAAKERCW